MTGRRLARYVHVRDAQGTPHVFGPRDEIPEWVADKVTNPRVWAADGGGLPAPSPEPAGVPNRGPGATPEPTPARAPVQHSVQNIATDTDAGDPEPTPPPKGGKGSGAAAWRRYAGEMDVAVEGTAERDDVIALLEARGVPTK